MWHHTTLVFIAFAGGTSIPAQNATAAAPTQISARVALNQTRQRTPTNACVLPSDPDIVPITPNKTNAGWAMSPDQRCTEGGWCAYACRSGMVSVQWDPSVACAVGAGCNSFNGGIRCGAGGEIAKPFPEKPFCEQGLDNISIRSELSQSVAFCQTVYPGNENMLIATVATPGCQGQILTSPPATYWMGTSAQFYVNPAGSTAANCNWGDPKVGPFGNWAPFVVGAGQAPDGLTYASLSINPNFPAVAVAAPLYRISLTCDECHGLNREPCSLDPRNGDTAACTVTVPPGAHAVIVISP